MVDVLFIVGNKVCPVFDLIGVRTGLRFQVALLECV